MVTRQQVEEWIHKMVDSREDILKDVESNLPDRSDMLANQFHKANQAVVWSRRQELINLRAYLVANLDELCFEVGD